jgi:hypothetical protein
MKVVFTKGILMQVREAKDKKDKDVQYIKIADQTGEYSFSSKDVDFAAVPVLEPMGFDLEVEGFTWEGKQFLSITKADIKQNGSA